MNVKVQRNYWYRILDFHLDLLNEKFLNKPLFPSIQQQIVLLLQTTTNKARQVETHPAWHVPLVVRFDVPNNRFYVEPENPGEIEFI